MSTCWTHSLHPLPASCLICYPHMSSFHRFQSLLGHPNLLSVAFFQLAQCTGQQFLSTGYFKSWTVAFLSANMLQLIQCASMPPQVRQPALQTLHLLFPVHGILFPTYSPGLLPNFLKDFNQMPLFSDFHPFKYFTHTTTSHLPFSFFYFRADKHTMYLLLYTL